MRDFSKIIAHTQKWEGGHVNDPDDNGGETNKGITYKTWRSVFGNNDHGRFLKMSDADWTLFYRKYYDAVKGDQIKSDGIAFFATQIAWGSGSGNAGKHLQRAVNYVSGEPILKVDGIIGSGTLAAVNACDPKTLFDKLVEVRIQFYDDIIAQRPQNAKFRKGWLNRLEDFRVTFRPK